MIALLRVRRMSTSPRRTAAPPSFSVEHFQGAVPGEDSIARPQWRLRPRRAPSEFRDRRRGAGLQIVADDEAATREACAMLALDHPAGRAAERTSRYATTAPPMSSGAGAGWRFRRSAEQMRAGCAGHRCHKTVERLAASGTIKLHRARAKRPNIASTPLACQQQRIPRRGVTVDVGYSG